MNTTNKFCVDCVHYSAMGQNHETGKCLRIVRLGVSPVTGKLRDKALNRDCAFERETHYVNTTASFVERLCNPEGIYWERKT